MGGGGLEDMGPALSTNPLICSAMARRWVGRLQLTSSCGSRERRDTSLTGKFRYHEVLGHPTGAQHSIRAMLCKEIPSTSLWATDTDMSHVNMLQPRVTEGGPAGIPGKPTFSGSQLPHLCRDRAGLCDLGFDQLSCPRSRLANKRH